MKVWKMTFLFNRVIFGVHVSFGIYATNASWYHFTPPERALGIPCDFCIQHRFGRVCFVQIAKLIVAPLDIALASQSI